MADQDHPARMHVKKLKDIHGGYKDFYKLLYGHEAPNQNELQRFINYVNRAQYNLEFLERVVSKTGFGGDISLKEFLLGEK